MSFKTMKKFLSYIFFIFGFSFMKDVLCEKPVYTKSNDQKIIGGYEADIKDVPYQAAVVMVNDKGAFACGGSIISKHYILTAAHCLTEGKTVYARVGSNHRNRNGVHYASAQFWQHPKYNNRTLDNDVGIIRTLMPIEYNSNTKAITLASRGINIPPGTEVLATGWGFTSENGGVSDSIRAVKLPIVSNEDCRQTYSYIADNMICAGVPEGGKSPCSGDSGGPARSKFGQIGVVSFIIGCAKPRYPGVFARVSDPVIRDWIKSVTGV